MSGAGAPRTGEIDGRGPDGGTNAGTGHDDNTDGPNAGGERTEEGGAERKRGGGGLRPGGREMLEKWGPLLGRVACDGFFRGYRLSPGDSPPPA